MKISLNKIIQKTLIAFAFSTVLLGSANTSFAAKCDYSVSNKTKHTVKLRLGFADQYQYVESTYIHRLGPGMTVTFDRGTAGSTLKVIDPGKGWVRYRLTALHVPGCFEWVAKKAKISLKDQYRYLTYLNAPKIGQVEITCNEDNYSSQCK